MEKKPEKVPSDTSKDDEREEHTTFALKSRATRLAPADDETDEKLEDAEETKGTSFKLQRRATRYPGPVIEDDNDDDNDAAEDSGGTSFKLQRRATTYPTANQRTVDEDDDEDADTAKATTTFKLQRRGSDDEGAPDDVETEKTAPFHLQRRATRYPGPIESDAKDDDDEEDEEAAKPPTINLQRRASRFPTAAEMSKLADHDAETPEESKPAVLQSVLKSQPTSSAASTSDSNQGETSDKVRAFPPSALKSRPKSPTTFDSVNETQNRGEEPKDLVPLSVLKTRPAHDIDKMEIPSFISKSSVTFRFYKYNLKATGEDAKNYDFGGSRPTMSRNTVLESTFHFIKICLGSGMATMPEAYKNCGIWTALALNMFIGVVVAYGMYMLTRSAQRLYGRVRVPMMLYPDVAQACLEVGPWKNLRKYGAWFRYTVEFTVALGLFCACCVYQVVMAMSLKQLVEGSYIVLHEGTPPLSTYIILLMLPCLLICMITTLKYLAPFTVVANLYVACVTITTIYYGITVPKISVVDYPAFKTVPGLFQFIGICIFSMNGIGATMSIENYMIEPKKFPMVIIIGMGIVIFEVTLIGFFGHWGYGDNVQSVITLNFAFRPFPIVLKIYMALVLYVSYALNFWVPFELVWYYVKLRHAPAQYWFWERIYRAIFVIIVTIVAYLLPNVYYFTALIGTLCLSNLVFLYPAFIELLVDWKEPGLGFLRWRLIKFIFFFLCGLTVFAGGTYINTKGLVLKVFYNSETNE